jgi:FlaG/FlaF family flagellin (archaellin)
MKHLGRSFRAISPVLAVLMMIAVAIAGSLVVYAWVMGYIDLSTEKSGEAIVVHSVTNDGSDLVVYVQNVGETVVQLEEKTCLYVNGVLVPCSISNVTVSDGTATMELGETAKLRYVGGASFPGEKAEVKVTTVRGVSAEKSGYPAGTEQVPSELDHFEFDTIASPQIADFAFDITIRAVDQYGELFTGYEGFNGLSFSGGTINPFLTGDFVSGVWSGEITVKGLGNNLTLGTVAASNVSCTGTSNPFGVTLEGALWAITHGGEGIETAHSIVQTFDGGYAIAGYTYSFGAGLEDFWLVKTDSSGNMEWSQTYGGPLMDRAYSVVQTSDGGYAIAGYTNSFGAGHSFWLVKTDMYGNEEWNKTHEELGGSVASSLVVTSDGGYGIAGGELLVKTYANGTMEWSKTYDHDITSLLVTEDKGYLLGGESFLIKTDESGELEWSKTYGVPESDRVIESVIETADGGYALTGYTSSSSAEGMDFWLIKTNSSGEMEWSKTYGGTSTEWAHSLIETPDGRYVLAGHTTSYGAGSADILLLKTE